MENLDLVSIIMKKCIEITENTSAQMTFKYNGEISPNGEIVVFGFTNGSFDSPCPDFRMPSSYIGLHDTRGLLILYDELCDLKKELEE